MIIFMIYINRLIVAGPFLSLGTVIAFIKTARELNMDIERTKLVGLLRITKEGLAMKGIFKG